MAELKLSKPAMSVNVAEIGYSYNASVYDHLGNIVKDLRHILASLKDGSLWPASLRSVEPAAPVTTNLIESLLFPK
jgi:hypothetical protein